MRIMSIDAGEAIELLRPMKSIRPLVSYIITHRVEKSGFISRDSLKQSLISLRFNIAASLVIIFFCPILWFILSWMSYELITPAIFDIDDPIAFVRYFAFLQSFIPMTILFWWVFNNRLLQCINAHIMLDILCKIYHNDDSSKDRDEKLQYYLNQATKEWNYYND